MNEENETLSASLKACFDKMIDTNISLDTLGIDVDSFKQEFRDEVMDRIYTSAAEELNNSSNE
jgi:hypothetical protein